MAGLTNGPVPPVHSHSAPARRMLGRDALQTTSV